MEAKNITFREKSLIPAHMQYILKQDLNKCMLNEILIHLKIRESHVSWPSGQLFGFPPFVGIWRGNVLGTFYTTDDKLLSPEKIYKSMY